MRQGTGMDEAIKYALAVAAMSGVTINGDLDSFVKHSVEAWIEVLS
jgi:hypothetical protein